MSIDLREIERRNEHRKHVPKDTRAGIALHNAAADIDALLAEVKRLQVLPQHPAESAEEQAK